MYKKIARSLIVISVSISAAQAEDWQFQTGIGKGLNKILIQQDGIANAEAASVGVHIPVAWQNGFDWAQVERTYIKVQYSHLWGNWREHGEQISISETALVFRWSSPQQSAWFGEIGVGVSHLSERVYQNIETYGQNNFALDFALGREWIWAPNWELSLRYRHYSNGYTHRPNPGLDYGALVLAYRF